MNVTVQYLNLSFFIKKSNGGYHSVTAFADFRRYSKPQPSLMPDADSTLRKLLSGGISLLLISQVPFIKSLRTRVYEILWRPYPSQLQQNTSALTSFSRKHQLVSSLTANLVYSSLKTYVAMSFPQALV